jgi:hypothetical protein
MNSHTGPRRLTGRNRGRTDDGIRLRDQKSGRFLLHRPGRPQMHGLHKPRGMSRKDYRAVGAERLGERLAEDDEPQVTYFSGAQNRDLSFPRHSRALLAAPKFKRWIHIIQPRSPASNMYIGASGAIRSAARSASTAMWPCANMACDVSSNARYSNKLADFSVMAPLDVFFAITKRFAMIVKGCST